MDPSQDECDYVTVDDVMLLYHIEVQHPELESFKCKNCDPALDPISFAGKKCSPVLIPMGPNSYLIRVSPWFVSRLNEFRLVSTAFRIICVARGGVHGIVLSDSRNLQPTFFSLSL